MTSYLIDINVWLALSWAGHPFSVPAHQWFETVPECDTRLWFCRIPQLELLRLLTNKMVMGDSVLTLGEAFSIYDRWIGDPRVELAAEARGVEACFRNASAADKLNPAAKVLMDAYLAGFAEAERATVVTFDKALAKMAVRRGTRHLLLRGARQ